MKEVTDLEAIKKAKKELKKYAKIDTKIALLDEQLEEAEQQIQKARGQQISDMPSRHSCTYDLSDYIVLKEKLEEQKKEAVQQKVKIESKLADVENSTYAEILVLRFKKELCWVEIAQCIHRSTSRTKALQKEALLAYSKVKI